VTAVQPEGTRLVRQIADTFGAAALIVERETRGLVPEVVDIGSELPMVGLEPKAQVADRVARQLGVERDRGGGELPAESSESRTIRVAAHMANLAPPRLLVLELREG